jgi:hypothetical protein
MAILQLSKPNQTNSKGGVKVSSVIPGVILIVCVIGALYFSGFFDESGLVPNDSANFSGVLTPTRDIEGTWTTTFATEFKISTDYQTFTSLDNVGSEYRTMTWTITPTSDENTVLVNVQFSYSNRTLISGSGYTPDVSPMQLTGTINGTQLTLTRGNQGPIEQIGSVGVFTFTTTQMEGTWHDHWEGAYEQNVYTQINGLKLMKQ